MEKVTIKITWKQDEQVDSPFYFAGVLVADKSATLTEKAKCTKGDGVRTWSFGKHPSLWVYEGTEIIIKDVDANHEDIDDNLFIKVEVVK